MKETLKKIIFGILFSLAFLFSIIILKDRSASIFRQLYIQVRYGFSLTVLLISVVVFAILQLKSKYREVFLFIVVLIIFSLALAGMWASGKSEPTMISGLIPLGDGENYYTDALRWLNGDFFSDYSARRPLFTAFLTTITKITNQNIQEMQALIMFFMAIAFFFSLKSMQKRFNSFAVTLFFVLIFLYSRQYIGCFVSETVGLIFGLSGFALLIEKYEDLNHWSFYLAIFLITLALNARAGAFFILPFLLLWILKIQNEQKIKWKNIFVSLCCMFLAFLITSLFMHYFGEGKNIPFSNYVYILYGLARGGAGWTQIMTDHPEIFSLKEIELTKEIWSLTYQLIVQRPQDFIFAFLKQYIYMFDISQTTKNVFSFVNSETHSLIILVQSFLYLLSIIGCFSLKKRDRKFSYLIIFSLIGILISVPFVTIQDTYYMRAYAATMPFVVLLPCLGIDFITRKKPFNVHQKENNGKGFIAFIVLILLATLFYPIVINRENQFSNSKTLRCEKDESHIIFSVNKGSSIRIFPENAFFLDWAPNFHKSRFYQNIRTYSLSDFVDPLSELDPPFELRVGINLENYEDVYIVFQGKDFITDYGIYELCAQEKQYSNSPWMIEIAKLFFAHDYQLIKSY